MSKVSDKINAIMEIYFEEENTSERYKILAELETAIRLARTVTVTEISCAELSELTKPASTAKTAQTVDADLRRLSKVINETAKLSIELTRETKLSDIYADDNVDSLDIVEIIMAIEVEFDVEIETMERRFPDFDMTLGEILDLRG